MIYNKTYQLIVEYIADAKYCCNILHELYGKNNETLLRAKVTGLIPKKGNINDLQYTFHGGGCDFKFKKGRINIDFGPNDRCDGFDYIKLKNYLFYKKEKFFYIEINNEQVLLAEFNELKMHGLIYQPRQFPNPELYYLKDW